MLNSTGHYKSSKNETPDLVNHGKNLVKLTSYPLLKDPIYPR